MLLFVEHHLHRTLTAQIWELEKDLVSKTYFRPVFSLMFSDRKVPESFWKIFQEGDLCRCNVCKAFLRRAVGEWAAVALAHEKQSECVQNSPPSPHPPSPVLLWIQVWSVFCWMSVLWRQCMRTDLCFFAGDWASAWDADESICLFLRCLTDDSCLFINVACQ